MKKLNVAAGIGFGLFTIHAGRAAYQATHHSNPETTAH